MKLDKDELAAITRQHKSDQALYDKCGITGDQSHKDRGKLLDHIESIGFMGAAGAGTGYAMGGLIVWVAVYFLLIRPEIVASTAWWLAHCGVAK